MKSWGRLKKITFVYTLLLRKIIFYHSTSAMLIYLLFLNVSFLYLPLDFFTLGPHFPVCKNSPIHYLNP